MRPNALALAVLLAACFTSHALAQDAKTPAAPAAALPDSLKDTAAQVGYAIGLGLGGSLKRDAVAIDPAMLAQGVKDGLSGAKPLLTEDQARAVLAKAQADAQARRGQAAAQAAAANKAQGDAFLKANAARPGVVSLPSGLQYLILNPGTGAKPKADDTVLCNYRGTLIDGTEFDSSYSRGQPASFPVGGVIGGWTEALQLMPTGSKWRLFVPAALAYGDKGAGGQIGPGATLIFEVELIKIEARG